MLLACCRLSRRINLFAIHSFPLIHREVPKRMIPIDDVLSELRPDLARRRRMGLLRRLPCLRQFEKVAVLALAHVAGLEGPRAAEIVSRHLHPHP